MSDASQIYPEFTELSRPFLTRPAITTVIAVALLVVGVASLALTPVRTDHDVFWHLKTGQVIVAGGWHLPETDPFTYGSEDVPWHNHEWLAQVTMHGLFRLGERTLSGGIDGDNSAQAGMRMVVLGKALILIGAFSVVARTLWVAGVNPTLACVIALLAGMASRWSLHCRPPVITDLFLAVEILVLTRAWHCRHPLPAAIACLFHFALWSNLHGGWLAGLVLLALWIAGDKLWILSHRRDEPFIRRFFQDRRLRVHSLLFGAALLGVLINPAGWHLYELTWRVMRESELIARIPEMMPPRFPEHWPFFALLLMAAAALVFGLFRRGIVRPGEGLALLFFGWQATSHLRHVPLFVIVAALPVGRLMQLYSDWWAQRLTLRGAELITLFKMLLLTLFVLVGVGTGLIVWKHRLIWEPHAPRNTRWFEGFGYEPTQYQDAACDALISAGAPPRLWTNLNIGGFMIWRLSPETLKVFTDSRFDVHGGGPQRVEMSLNGVGPDGGVPDPDWEQVLDDLGVNVAVLEKATPLVRAMWASPNWVAVHEWTAPGRRWRDGTMTFIRDVPENETAISVVRRYAEVRNQSPQPPPSPM